MSIKNVKRPTLKSIASMTGLGITTVSKALKDAPDIAKRTRDRVQLVAKEVGYQPDKTAVLLRTGKTHAISFIMNTDEQIHSMQSEFILGITKALNSTPYNLTIMPCANDDDPLAPIRYVHDARVSDGVILARTEPKDQRLLFLEQVGMPVVTFGRSNLDHQHAFYDFDGVAFGRDAALTLAGFGCKRIAMLYPPVHLNYTLLIQDGFNQALEKTGLSEASMGSIDTEDPIEVIAEHVCSMLKETTRPDGFACGSAKCAIGVMAGIEKAGLTIGKDVQLVAKQSTSNLLKWFGKPIYYIGEDFTTAGYETAKCLLGILDGDPVTDHQKIGYTEVVGQSVLE